MKKLLLFLFILLLTENIHAQREKNIWYFGIQAGLDFNSGSPVALTNSEMAAPEGSGSISDTSGNLLFYTDGETVWNKNHVIMPNGTGLLGNSSSTQSTLIIQRPESDSLYYIFTTDDLGGVDGLRYSIVDMSLNGGMGDVSIKNVLLNPSSTEKLTAIFHDNERDLWVIAHEKDNNVFNAFLVSTSGVDPVSINSSIGTPITPAFYIGYMKASPTGRQIALTGFSSSGLLELFDFNNLTGLVTNPYKANSGGYGLEFSPDGRYLYLSELNAKNIYQFDALVENESAFAASKISIGSSPNYLRALQLGPDQKIYVARHNSSWLGVINSPNTHGISCNYVDSAVSLSGKTCLLGLPNFVQQYNPLFSNSIFNHKNKNQHGSQNLSIYPNPAYGNTQISYQLPKFSQVTLEIYTPLGQKEETLVSEKQQQGNYQYSFEGKTAGIYFVKLSMNGESYSQKLILH